MGSGKSNLSRTHVPVKAVPLSCRALAREYSCSSGVPGEDRARPNVGQHERAEEVQRTVGLPRPVFRHQCIAVC